MVLIFTAGTTVYANSEEPFSRFIKPMTNPVYFDDVQNRTYIHAITILQQLPNHVRTEAGRVPLDGDLQFTAVRATFAINERFSLIAAEDGYIDFDPDETLDGGNGWADLALGVKGAIIYDPDDEFILSGKVLFGMSNGSSEVYQGNGDGNVVPSLAFLKGWDKFQLQGTVGSIIPFNHNKESTELYTSWHASYAVTPEIFPLIEFNYFRVIRKGHREPLKVKGTNIRTASRFEGGDVYNLGSENGLSHRNFATVALGCRFRYFDMMDVGISWETPLTQQNQGLMKNRYSFDIVLHF
jgi:hypothetical protein